LAACVILYWLWTGTALIPEKAEKDVGLGLKLPLYVSGSASIGWWAMFITMLADMTAFVCIVFGYFFFWTVREDFPPDTALGPGLLWPAIAALLVAVVWISLLLARRWNKRDWHAGIYGGLLVSAGSAALCIAALLAGPFVTDLDPTKHVYDATVWLLVIWTAFHVLVGVIMQLYCVARRFAGRMTAQHDIDICNVVLYWHFVAATVLITVGVIAGFPLVME
jgi:cytochrome c oxidase subunit I+III